MSRMSPWIWVELWCKLWNPDFEPTNWYELYLMQELNNLLVTNPYPSDVESNSSDEDREYPEISPYELNPEEGNDWEIKPNGKCEKC